MIETLRLMNVERAWVVHGAIGLDEVNCFSTNWE
jgi:anthranilate phosphoribosyltransferase